MRNSSRTLPDQLQSQLGDALSAARRLIGCTLGRREGARVRSGIIVETEAYLPDDPASHSFRGRTRRNASMFGAAGTAYVYTIHRSHCMNVVTGTPGRGEAVLIRALEPTAGLELMEEARERASAGNRPPTGYLLTNGPGKLCQALGITLADDGVALLGDGGLFLEDRRRAPRVAVSRRVGISKGREAAYRFFIEGSPWVSR